ncbi:hypothetical protein LXL04_003410 [Taraxacum kok-saghyz]
MALEDFEPLFGEPKVEWSATGSATTPVRRFLFQVHAPDSSHLRFHATDFFSSSFAAVRSIEQLDDMRDDTGIGGSWSEFLEYLVNSIKFGDVKLILEGKSKSDGHESARLIAQKSKGMPRISISLKKCVGIDANETMAMLSLDLFKAHQRNQKLLLQEQEGHIQLTKKLSAEQEKSEHVQKQLDGLHYPKRHKSQIIHDKLTSDNSSASTLLDVSDVQTDQNPNPMKASKRVMPAHRRSKVRGALLRDTEDD